MPTKKKAAASKKKKPVKGPRIAQRSKASRRKSKPQFLTTPDGTQVWIATATVQDVQEAAKRGRHPFSANKDRSYLVTVPSKTLRQGVYEQAAAALEELETRVLPPYAGRPWRCVTKCTDPHGSGKTRGELPYFLFHEGQLELATWPHLLEKMPAPPRFPGFGSSRPKATRVAARNDEEEESDDEEEEEEEPSEWDLRIRELQDREPCALTELAYQERWRVPLPHVTYKWISPLHEVFTSRKSAWEHAVQLCKREVYLDKVLEGYGANGKPVQIKGSPTKKATLQAGKWRFERDGLWVIGQEEEWQLERLAMLHTNNNTPPSAAATSTVTATATVTATGTTTATAQTGGTKRRRLTGLNYYLQSRRVEYRRMRLQELQQEQIEVARTEQDNAAIENKATVLSTALVGSNDRATATDTATSTAATDANTSNDAATEAATDAAAKASATTENLSEPTKGQDTARVTAPDAVSVSPEASPRAVLASSVGRSDDPKQDPATGAPVADTTKVEGFDKKKEKEKKSALPKVSFTMRDADTELRVLFKKLSEEERQDWNARAKAIEDAGSTAADGAKEPSASAVEEEALVGSKPLTRVDHVEKAASNPSEIFIRKPKASDTSGGSTIESEAPLNSKAVSPSPPPISQDDDDEHEHEPNPCTRVNLEDRGWAKSQQPSGQPRVVSMDGSAATKEATASQPATSSTAVQVAPPKLTMRGPSKNWTLNAEQVKLCFDAGMEHYDQIMRTVSARDLTRELQDGFDLLRERGRGRYDMELPAFDQPEFSFLTDCKKAPWMPVVREILGKDVVIIHKGMFLSLPGAEPQKYHQDGVHLTTQYQKPCHAVNVFVPLVDLTLKNGPTEFCRGTHILDQDDFDRDFLVTPEVEAGTPIIFDYRLGHRGLGNTSESCRPIVYCTYARAADGKEFRDSMNFSRKRYHKIGDLVSKVPSREERLQKRARGMESSDMEQAIAESLQVQPQVSSGDDLDGVPQDKKLKVA